MYLNKIWFLIFDIFHLQAEYRPCVVFSLCWDMLREFLQGFLGSCVSNIPPHYFQV